MVSSTYSDVPCGVKEYNSTRREASDNQAALYPQADLSVFQSNLLVFQHAIRHSLTGREFTELLQLLSVHLPKGTGIPKICAHV